MTRKVLVLGGTAEALALAQRLATAPGLRVITSLAGRTRVPVIPPGELRIGGFGGVHGMADYLAEARIDRVVNAAHPFARQIARHAQAACERRAIALATLSREPWRPASGDRWIPVGDEAEAAAALPGLALPRGSSVLLALGRQHLASFLPLDRLRFVTRMVDAPGRCEPPLPPHFEVITGRGPFELADERSLLKSKAVRALVCRNSGGEGAHAKLVAARELALPVVMVERPPRPLTPAGLVLHSVGDAADWVMA